MATIGKQTKMFTTSNNCIIMHAYGKKNSVDEPVCRGAENDADVEKGLADSRGRRR